MNFDVNKVKTAVTAESVKVGSVGFFANSLDELKKKVEEYKAEDFHRVNAIRSSEKAERFKMSKGSFSLFYPASVDKQEQRKISGKDVKNFIDEHSAEELAKMTVELQNKVAAHLEAISELVKENEMIFTAGSCSIIASMRIIGENKLQLLLGTESSIIDNSLNLLETLKDRVIED